MNVVSTSVPDLLTDRKGSIYLDYQATTPTDPRVVDAMLPFFSQKFGNPHSNSHAHGWEASDAVENARQQIADLIGAESREIIFTSGATEANNLALKGAGRFSHRKGNHIITSKAEHKCVLESCRQLEDEGLRVTYLDVNGDGFIELHALEAAMSDDTLMVSIMAVNNETGVIQPMADIGALCRARSIYFHSDGAQAVGKIAMNVNDMNIDLMSISGHKLYGPMGIGALYVRRRPRVRLQPLFDGGGQERGMRSGTLPAPLCVGMGRACELSRLEMSEETSRLTERRDQLLSVLGQAGCEVIINGSMEQRFVGNLNLRFPGIRAEDLLTEIRGVAVSTGSACTSASVEPSYVLRAMGLTDDEAAASIRIGLGRFTTIDEIDRAADIISSAVLRHVSDKYEKQQFSTSAQNPAPAA
jgi:cysteine desulfurase